MTRARMLLIGLWMSGLLAGGCGSISLLPRWMRAQDELAERPVTSDPVSYGTPTSAPAGAVADDGTQPADETAALNDRMKQFFGQFPMDQRGADPSAGRTPRSASPATQPATNGEWTTYPSPRISDTYPPSSSSKGPTGLTGTRTEAVSSPRPPEAAATAPRRPRVELLDIRPVVEPAIAPGLAEPSPSANQPAQTPSPSPLPNTLAGQIQELEQLVATNPQHVDDQLRLRLLYLATGQEGKASAPFDGLDPVQGELLSALCGAVVAATEIIRQPGEASESAWLAVEELHRLLGQQSSVVIPRMALVTRVSSFGDYQAITPPRFTAGQPVHVFLYTEVANFRSKPTGDGKVQTLLSQRVEIYDAGGKIIWQRTEPGIEDRTLTPRRDFFIPFPINLPVETPPGEYVLKATIEDKIGATTDQQRTTFTIGQP